MNSDQPAEHNLPGLGARLFISISGGVAEDVMSMKPRRIKVLIIDCHVDILITFEHLLEDEGYDTTTAWTGQDALKALQGQVFDLVLANEYLPDMDAELFISELRRRAGIVPCIVMQPSATQITDIGRFLATGAAAVVCKWLQTKVLKAVYAHVFPTSTIRTQSREAAA